MIRYLLAALMLFGLYCTVPQCVSAEQVQVEGATISISSTPFTIVQDRKKILVLRVQGSLERINDAQVVFQANNGTRIVVEGGEVLTLSMTSPKPIAFSLLPVSKQTFGLLEYPIRGELSNVGFAGVVRGSGSGAPLMFASAKAPVIHTRGVWSAVFNEEDLLQFHYSRNKRIKVRSSAAHLRVHLAFGSFSERLQRLNKHIPPLYQPPDWAYGVQYWRDDARRYLQGSANAQERILKDLDELSRQQLPISSYLIDRPYGTGSFGWGNFDFDVTQFPNINALLAAFQQRNIKLILWGANIASGQFGAEARERRLLLKSKGSVHRAVNIFRPEGERLLVEGLRKLPADGWKIDRGDEGEIPARLAARHAALLPSLFQKGSASSTPFLFARNLSMLGRSSAAVWNGDSWATFEGLRYSLVSGLRAGLIFFPFWGSDTGGYNGQPTEELFIRWLQFSSLSPFMEIKLEHATRSLWDGYSDELYTELRRSTTRHEALRSYVKELMDESQSSGMPVMRPLFLHFPREEPAWAIQDQYLYGKRLLVAPVLQPGQRVRRVYIPSGNWRAVCSGASFSGPRWVEYEVKLSEIPLFSTSDTLRAILVPSCS